MDGAVVVLGATWEEEGEEEDKGDWCQPSKYRIVCPKRLATSPSLSLLLSSSDRRRKIFNERRRCRRRKIPLLPLLLLSSQVFHSMTFFLICLLSWILSPLSFLA